MKNNEIPAIVLEDHQGESRSLQELLQEGALTVLVFYRGDW